MRNKLRWLIMTIAMSFLVVFGYYVYSITQFAMEISKPIESHRTSEEPVAKEQPDYQIPVWEGKERVNILLLGGDGRELEDAGRSDSMMLVSIEPVSHQIHVFSILRDTYVDIPGHGKNKINAALAYGGPELSMKTVSELVGLPVHYYFYIDLDSFIELIDTVGGVEFDVEKDMKYLDPTDKPEYQIDLKKGVQHLDGNKALQYVRFRKDAMSDYARTERQRNLLIAVADKLQSSSTLLRLPSLLKEISPYIHTNMNVEDMVKLAALCYQSDVHSTQTAQLPPFTLLKEDKINGSAVIVVQPKQLQQYLAEVLSKTSDEKQETAIKQQALNN